MHGIAAGKYEERREKVFKAWSRYHSEHFSRRPLPERLEIVEELLKALGEQRKSIAGEIKMKKQSLHSLREKQKQLAQVDEYVKEIKMNRLRLRIEELGREQDNFIEKYGQGMQRPEIQGAIKKITQLLRKTEKAQQLMGVQAGRKDLTAEDQEALKRMQYKLGDLRSDTRELLNTLKRTSRKFD